MSLCVGVGTNHNKLRIGRKKKMKYGVGIDVAKGKSTVAILAQTGELIQLPFEIEHTIEGMKLLEDKLSKLPKEDVKIVMEETGNYHLPILGYLLDNQYFVVAENALKIKKYLDRDLRKAKTDNKDALKLADYACENWYKLTMAKEQEAIYNDLKFLSRQYLSNISIQTNLKVDFVNLCDLVFPGFNNLLNENNYILGLEIFKIYYHPDLIINKNQSEFITEIDELAKKLGHKSAGKNLATKIFNLAKITLSPRPSNEYSQLAVTSCANALILIIKTSSTIITEMNKLARKLPEYEVVSEMDGVGAKLTSRIIAEIGDIRTFKNAGSLIANAGIDAPPYQSGQFEAQIRHISKRGNSYLRRTGYEIMKAIKTSCKEGVELYDYIVKKEMEGKPKKVAKIAGLNKFLRQYFGIVKKKYKELGIW